MAEGTLVEAEAPRMGRVRNAPRWETEARERLTTALKRFQKPLAELASRDANEGDTRLLVTDFLCEGLGYDKYSDLTTEYQVKGEFADYGIRIDKQLAAFVEVKRVATKLEAKHLRQVEMYAVNEGVEWMFLTNGKNWKVYHLSPGMPVQIDLALDIDLGQDDPSDFFYLTRESLKRRQIDELWKAARATSPKAIAQVLLSAPVVAAVQREFRRQANHTIPIEEAAELVRTVLRPECFEK